MRASLSYGGGSMMMSPSSGRCQDITLRNANTKSGNASTKTRLIPLAPTTTRQYCYTQYIHYELSYQVSIEYVSLGDGY